MPYYVPLRSILVRHQMLLHWWDKVGSKIINHIPNFSKSRKFGEETCKPRRKKEVRRFLQELVKSAGIA